MPGQSPGMTSLVGTRPRVKIHGRSHNSPIGPLSVEVEIAEGACARMRVPVKRIWRKFGYPTDLQDAAV